MHGQRRSHKGLETGDPFELKADAGSGVLTGYGSKFWEVDSYGEFTVPGCFAKTIAERGPRGADRVLYRYEHDVTIGKPTVLREDETGLFVEARVSDDGMYGTALRRQLADGVPYGQSIGYRRVGYRTALPDDPLVFPDNLPGWVRTIPREELIGLTECRLPEVSAVSFPAVDTALVEGYRSERRLKALGTLLDDLTRDRLTDDERAALAAIVAAWPADTAPEGGETPPPPRAARTALRRNRSAEHILAQMGLLTTELQV